MQLLDMVFVGRNVLPSAEYKIHQFRIASDFLLITRVERFDLEIGEQVFDFTIGKFASFNARRRADAFKRGDPTQSKQPIQRQCAQRTPSPFEFVDPGDQTLNFRCDLEGGDGQHFLMTNH